MEITSSSSLQSFILQMSMYYEKEIGGFQIQDQTGKFKLLVPPFARNTAGYSRSIKNFRFGEFGRLDRSSSGVWQFKDTYSFRMISWFHTHPGGGPNNLSGDAFNYGGVNGYDQEYTNHFGVPGHIYGGRQGNFNTLYPLKK